jgi:hypothetical protein
MQISALSPRELQLAGRFWIQLGRPTQYNNDATMESWASIFKMLDDGLQLAAIPRFLLREYVIAWCRPRYNNPPENPMVEFTNNFYHEFARWFTSLDWLPDKKGIATRCILDAIAHHWAKDNYDYINEEVGRAWQFQKRLDQLVGDTPFVWKLDPEFDTGGSSHWSAEPYITVYQPGPELKKMVPCKLDVRMFWIPGFQPAEVPEEKDLEKAKS